MHRANLNSDTWYSLYEQRIWVGLILNSWTCQEQVQENYIEAEIKSMIEDSKYEINRMKKNIM